MDATTPRPGAALTQMLLANRVQQAVYVAAKLGIADLLADGPSSVDELAERTQTHAGALYRLLRVLASYGVFAETETGRFELTPVAALLRSGTRESKRAFALWSGEVAYELFGSLEYSIRTGEPAFDKVFGAEFYTYLEQHPAMGELFDQFMSRQTAPLGPILAAYDLAGVHTVIDVGGGRGELITAVLRAHPDIRGVLFDQPRAVRGAAAVLSAAGVADRCRTVTGNYLEQVPPDGDIYLLKNVVHGLEDDTTTQVLSNCRKAMADGGRVLLVEFVIPPGNDPFPGKLMDLLMLVGTHGGRERTEAEFSALFAAAGLSLTNVVTTKYVYSVIEAKAA